MERDRERDMERDIDRKTERTRWGRGVREEKKGARWINGTSTGDRSSVSVTSLLITNVSTLRSLSRS